MDDTYDFNSGIWSTKNKSKTYYRFDYRGQDEAIKQIETKATIHINAYDIITAIEFENVPFEAHIPHYESENAVKHERESAAMIERERIIKLISDYNGGCECSIVRVCYPHRLIALIKKELNG